MPGNLQAPDRTHLNRVRADIGQRAPLPLLLILPLPGYRTSWGKFQLLWYFSKTNLTIDNYVLAYFTVCFRHSLRHRVYWQGGKWMSIWALSIKFWIGTHVSLNALLSSALFNFKDNWQLERQLWRCMWYSHAERSCSLEYVTHTMSGVQSHRENHCLW